MDYLVMYSTVINGVYYKKGETVSLSDMVLVRELTGQKTITLKATQESNQSQIKKAKNAKS